MYAASSGLATRSTRWAAPGPALRAAASASARRSSHVIAGVSARKSSSTGTSVQPMPSTATAATSRAGTPAAASTSATVPHKASHHRSGSISARAASGRSRSYAADASATGVPWESQSAVFMLEVPWSTVTMCTVVGVRSRRGPDGAPMWRDGAVEVPEVFPALAVLPEEDLALDQPAVPVDRRDRRHLLVGERLAGRPPAGWPGSCGRFDRERDRDLPALTAHLMQTIRGMHAQPLRRSGRSPGPRCRRYRSVVRSRSGRFGEPIGRVTDRHDPVGRRRTRTARAAGSAGCSSISLQAGLIRRVAEHQLSAWGSSCSTCRCAAPGPDRPASPSGARSS